MEAGVKIIFDELKRTIIGKDKEELSIITSEKYKKIKSNNDLLIALDLNKTYLTSCKDYLKQFKNIIVIDHHKEDNNTINTEFKFIDPNVSSTSEIIAELLCSYNIKYDKRIADYLLAGIYLDTDKLRRNVGAKTFMIVSKLVANGADVGRINDLFTYDFVSDRKVQDLVGRTLFLTYTFAISIADGSTTYTREELAKVADYLLKYRTDAAFAAGYISENQVAISARSKGTIDVGEVMKQLNGGGNYFSAATKIEEQSIEEVEMSLKRILKPGFYREEDEQK